MVRPSVGNQVIAGHWGRGVHMKLDESEKRSTNSIGLLRCTEMTREVFCRFHRISW
jgi:hypothetical protein